MRVSEAGTDYTALKHHVMGCFAARDSSSHSPTHYMTEIWPGDIFGRKPVDGPDV
jgi:hypothetical protein